MSEQQVPPESTVTGLPGSALRAGREKLGLTVHQVAAKLNLSPRVVEQMESNLLAELGAPVYAKGYLRQYAGLAGCTEDSIVGSYMSSIGRQGLSDPVPVPVTHRVIPAPRKLLPNWALWSVAALIVVALVVVLMNLEPVRQSMDKSSVATATIPPPVPTVESSPLAAVMANAEADAAATNSQMQTAGGMSADPAAVENGQVAGAADLSLSLKFAGDSWVEIYDVRQRKVLYGMGHKGVTQQAHGVGPLKVLFGSASQVQLSVNGAALPVPATRTINDVARFTISPAGGVE